ncbi:MAG: DUF1385 domain-containing protein [Fimbriimonadaceae bacterium]|nr:DUF1385 domain-containing protein [Fimbriimonadaceae bacterium]
MPAQDPTTFGGQAIVEGVMMRSRNHFAVAVRAPNGQVVLQQEPLSKSWLFRQKWLLQPFLRGTFALLDAMSLGIKAMNFASHIQLDEKYLPEGADGKTAIYGQAPAEGDSEVVKPAGGKPDTIRSMQVGVAMVFGVAMGLGLFVFVPNLLAEPFRNLGMNPTAINLVSGLFKLVIFIGYLLLISRMEAIRRVFQYHGAEHKAINALEMGEPLTVDACLKQTRLHPRCGTSFAIVVLLISIVLFTFVPRYPIPGLPLVVNVLVRFGIELVVLPIVAGIGYELIRIAGKFRRQKWVHVVFWPGLMTQYVTTAEPDAGQMEVAILSLKAVIEAEEALAAAA